MIGYKKIIMHPLTSAWRVKIVFKRYRGYPTLAEVRDLL